LLSCNIPSSFFCLAYCGWPLYFFAGRPYQCPRSPPTLRADPFFADFNTYAFAATEPRMAPFTSVGRSVDGFESRASAPVLLFLECAAVSIQFRGVRLIVKATGRLLRSWSPVCFPSFALLPLFSLSFFVDFIFSRRHAVSDPYTELRSTPSAFDRTLYQASFPSSPNWSRATVRLLFLRSPPAHNLAPFAI